LAADKNMLLHGFVETMRLSFFFCLRVRLGPFWDGMKRSGLPKTGCTQVCVEWEP